MFLNVKLTLKTHILALRHPEFVTYIKFEKKTKNTFLSEKAILNVGLLVSLKLLRRKFGKS